jgi:hypothetical protein
MSSSEEQIPDAIERLDLVSAGPPQFEFTSAQNQLIADLARKMRFVGNFFIVLSVVSVVAQGIQYPAIRIDLSFLIFILVGVWTRRAATALGRIVDTQGKDITHVMEAFESFRTLYGFLYWLLIIALVVAIVLAAWLALGGSLVLKVGR